MNALTSVYRIRQHTARRVKHFQQQQTKHVPTMSTAETAAMARKELPALRTALLPELQRLSHRLAANPGARDAELIAHTTPAGNIWWTVIRLRRGVASMAALLTYRTADGALHGMHFSIASLNDTVACAHHYPAELLRAGLRMSAFDTNLHEAAGRMMLHGYARPDAERAFPLEHNGPLCDLRVSGLHSVRSEDGQLISYHCSRSRVASA